MEYKTINRLRRAGRVMMMSCALLFAVCFAGGTMLEANADQVNNFLKTSTTKITGGGKYDTFTPDEQYLKNGKADTAALVEAHRQMGIRLAEEGSVLLKNNALPLSTANNKITLMGYRSTAAYANYGMDIGSPEEETQNVSFESALREVGFDVNSVVCNAYNAVAATPAYTGKTVNKLTGTGYYVTGLTADNRYNVEEPSIDEIKASAGESAFNSSISQYSGAGSVGLVVIGRPSSEQGDYFTGDIGRNEQKFTQSKSKNVLSLSDGERALLNYAKTTFDKVVVVVTTANAMELSELEADSEIDAILWAGYPGNYGFIGVANILAGNANPSGRLAATYASDSTSSPAMRNYGLYLYSNNAAAADGSGTSYALNTEAYFGGAYVVQAEGIYVGYKYYETRYEDSVLNPSSNASSSAGVGAYASDAQVWKYADEVTYPFGYGLSYTTFEQKISQVTFSDDGKPAEVEVSVENKGEVAGKSVIQLYGQSPYTDYDRANGVEKAAVQLLAYEKVDVPAHDTQTVTVEVDMQYLASYDAYGAGTYIMEKSGDYYFALGCNSDGEGAHAAVNNILAAKGKTEADGMDGAGLADAAYKFAWDGDERTFATSKAGVEIKNQLTDMDYNTYKANTVTYLSRSNWQTTWPKSYTSIEATPEMVKYLTNNFYALSSDDDVSDIKYGATYEGEDDINFTDMFGSDFDDERWQKVLDKLTIEEAVRFSASGNRSFQQLDSVYFLSNNAYTENGSVGIQKTLSQQADANAPWYVAADDANAAYKTNSYGGAPLMATCWSHELMYEMGKLWGNDALFVNIPMVWAPSLNIHRTPYNGRNGEYYSEDGVLSGYTAYDIGTGALSKGLITAIKHFAFNTQETSRLGLSTFMTEQAARENELRGFQIALEGFYDAEGNRSSLLGIMTAYNRAGATYAGAHTGLMQGILRGEWDFNGYATSDLAQSGSSYMPYEESILAGTTNFDTAITNDVTIWRTTVTDLVAAIDGDAGVLSALRQDMHYALWAFSQSNLANWMTDTTRVVWAWNWWRAVYIGLEILSGAAIAGGFVIYILSETLFPAMAERKKNQVKEKE